MTTVAIELNDAGITVARGTSLLPESPGYALLDDERLVLGVDARRRAHLHPRRIHHRFWDQLALEPLPEPTDLAQTWADLASAHLLQVWDRAGAGSHAVLFAVPASFSREQLGLLLGISQAGGVPVTGLVDAGLAAAVGRCPAARIVHVDLQLHRAQLTHLRGDATLARVGTDSIPMAGLIPLHDAWAKRIAETFIRHTRFDPFEQARTEQQLYDLLPECLGWLRRESEVAVEMIGGAKAYRISMRRETLLEASRSAYHQLAAQVDAAREPGEAIVALLSARAGALPGLADLLGELAACRVETLPIGASALGALVHEEQVRSTGSEIRLVVSLERDLPEVEDRAASPIAAAMPASPRESADTLSERPPTHVLQGDRAHSIRPGPLAIATDLADDERGVRVQPARGALRCAVHPEGDQVILEVVDGSEIFVNARRVEGRTKLRLGDRIRSGPGGEELRLIVAETEHGA